MKPSKIGDFVKFSNPISKEESKLIFTIKEIFFYFEKTRAIVQLFDTTAYLKPEFVYLVDDLELIK